METAGRGFSTISHQWVRKTAGRKKPTADAVGVMTERIKKGDLILSNYPDVPESINFQH